MIGQIVAVVLALIGGATALVFLYIAVTEIADTVRDLRKR